MLSAMRALVIDDDDFVRAMLLRCLSLWGWEPVECRSVADARRAFEDRRPELVLCDIDLPDGDGIELAQSLLTVVPRVRVLMMSGDPANLERAHLAGLSPGLLKPFELAALRALLEA